MKLKALLAAGSAMTTVFAVSGQANAAEYYMSLFGGGNWLDDNVMHGTTGPIPNAPYITFTGPTTLGFFYSGIVSGDLSSEFDGGYIVGLALGGKTDWGLRGELEFAYRDNEGVSNWGGVVNGQVYAYTGPTGIFTGPMTGVLTAPEGDITVQAYSIMANVWYDFDMEDSSFRPYIGGGVGIAYLEANIDMPGPGTAVLSGPPGAGFTFTTATSIDGDDGGSFAYQLGAGLAFDIADGVELYAEYRYFEAVGVELDFTQSFGQIDSFDYVSQSVLGGIRIPFGEEVVAAPSSPPVAGDAPPPAKTYIVFFDFNKSNLTAEAQSVVAEAADAYKTTGSVRVQVVGHTDTVGSASYNQQLSERRAASVAAEMVRLGVPSDSISTEGRGFSDPMVPTGPGVREPQNRRAVIDLQ